MTQVDSRATKVRLGGIALILLSRQACWGAVMGVDKAGGSWSYFVRAVNGLFRGDGLDLYARHPELQFGPVSTIQAAPFVWIGEPIGSTLAMAAMAIRNAHFDDVIALALSCLAVHAIRCGHTVGAAVSFGLAVDAKPWALAFVAVLLVLPRRDWPRALAALVVTIAVAWLPFFLAAPTSVSALRFTLSVDADSVLALFGLAGEPMPVWVRPAQLLVGVGLAALLTWAGPAEAAIFAVLTGRILLDPAAHNYYAAGAVLAAVLADRAVRHAVPWLTIGTALVLWLPHRLPGADLSDPVLARLRLGWALASLAVVVSSALWQTRVARVARITQRTA